MLTQATRKSTAPINGHQSSATRTALEIETRDYCYRADVEIGYTDTKDVHTSADGSPGTPGGFDWDFEITSLERLDADTSDYIEVDMASEDYRNREENLVDTAVYRELEDDPTLDN